MNSHLFTLKATINGQEVRILVDPGGDRTIFSPSLFKKVETNHHGSIPLTSLHHITKNVGKGSSMF